MPRTTVCREFVEVDVDGVTIDGFVDLEGVDVSFFVWKAKYLY